MKKKFKNEKLLHSSVEDLELSGTICTKLLSSKIDTVEELCNKTRGDLRELDFVQGDIKLIVAKLQLKGLDIKGNEY